MGRVGGKEIESWVVSTFSTPVPLLATLQALSPHQAQKVYRLLGGSCGRGLDTRNLERWCAFVWVLGMDSPALLMLDPHSTTEPPPP